MSTKIIKVPRRLDLPNTLIFVNEFCKETEADEFLFDFGEVRWIEPFPLLYLSCAISIFDGMTGEMPVGVINYENRACNYASHMGFFQAFRIDHGNSPGQAAGNMNYIPIRILDVERWKEEARESRRPVGEVIEKHAKNYAQILTRSRSGDLVDTLKFSLREILRNVVEHSGASQIGFCGQYWPSKGFVEISIQDTGMGLRQSLSSNPYLDKDMDDSAAVNYALLPGISGKMYKGKYSDPYDDWENSGYGLFMASEICRNGGSFFICSGNAGMILREKNKDYIHSPLNVTAVRMRLNTNTLEPMAQALSNYRRKGEDVAKKIYGANLSASAASSMLTKDFT